MEMERVLVKVIITASLFPVAYQEWIAAKVPIDLKLYHATSGLVRQLVQSSLIVQPLACIHFIAKPEDV
uniref:Putative secreted protein n=1 Tax=Anopheles darlingi TaxID=43151 RepID=A0A2M4D866_ANODA